MKLRERLAEPALDEDGEGLHPEAVVALVDDTCAVERDDCADAAVTWFRSQVDTPTEEFWTAIPLPIHCEASTLTLGR